MVAAGTHKPKADTWQAGIVGLATSPHSNTRTHAMGIPVREHDGPRPPLDVAALARMSPEEILASMTTLCQHLSGRGKQALIECIWMASNRTEQASFDLPYIGATLSAAGVTARLQDGLVRGQAHAAASATHLPPGATLPSFLGTARTTLLRLGGGGGGGGGGEGRASMMMMRRAPGPPGDEAATFHTLNGGPDSAGTVHVHHLTESEGEQEWAEEEEHAVVEESEGEAVAQEARTTRRSGGPTGRHATEEVILAILMGALMRQGRASGGDAGGSSGDE